MNASTRQKPKREKLTATIVNIASPDEGEFIWDTVTPGFGLRVRANSKSFVLRYSSPFGEERRLAIGKWGALTVEQARKVAQAHLYNIAQGGDPLTERKTRRAAPTVRDLGERYMKEHSEPEKRPHVCKDDRMMLDQYIYPVIGPSKKVVSVTRSDCMSVLHQEKLKDKGPMRNRVRALVSHMFSKAIEWEFRKDSPAIKLPSATVNRRNLFLSDEQISRLLTVLDAQKNQEKANVIRLLILTGARLGEVLGARWAEFDLSQQVWTKPATRTKQKDTAQCHLGSTATALLADMRAKAAPTEERLFPKSNGRDYIARFWRRVSKEAGLEGFRCHDLRHTYASHLLQAGAPLKVIQLQLGHKDYKTTLRYAHIGDEPARAAAERFGNKVSALKTGQTAEVIPLAAAR